MATKLFFVFQMWTTHLFLFFKSKIWNYFLSNPRLCKLYVVTTKLVFVFQMWTTQVMAIEFGMYNVRVNAISPGLFKSEITEGLLQKSWLNNVTLKMVPLQTFGTLDPAVTSLVRFLVHDSSRYITGNILIVDAGSSLPVSQFSLPFEFYFCFRSLVLGLGPSPFPTGIKRDHWCLSGLRCWFKCEGNFYLANFTPL